MFKNGNKITEFIGDFSFTEVGFFCLLELAYF